MELRQLEYFHMASRMRNITRAAERLGVSQPNITVAIKKLEAELGVQLFDRRQKQLFLTAEGEVFLSRIDRALHHIQDAVMEVNDYKQLQKGSIKIGIPPMMGAYMFPKIFSSFRRQYTHLDVFLYEEGSITIRSQLERDELDFGIIIITDASPPLEVLQMTTNQLMACVPENSPLAEKGYISAEDIASSDVIMLKEGAYLRELVKKKMEAYDVAPNIILESNQVITIKGLVANGVGMAFLLDFVAENSPGIRALPLKTPIFVDIGLAWKKGRYVSKAAQSFIDFCQDNLMQMTLL